MLKTILSISGKPGLYKMVSQGKNLLIVESLVDKKRVPAYARDKVISLGDIAIYTNESETPLYEVFNSIKKKENGQKTSLELSKATPDDLRNYLAEILPEFDRERVYPSDIKRLIGWYNLLLNAGITDFDPQKSESEEISEENETAAEVDKDAPKKTAKAKTTTAKKTTTPQKTAAKQQTVKTTQRSRQKQG